MLLQFRKLRYKTLRSGSRRFLFVGGLRGIVRQIKGCLGCCDEAQGIVLGRDRPINEGQPISVNLQI